MSAGGGGGISAVGNEVQRDLNIDASTKNYISQHGAELLRAEDWQPPFKLPDEASKLIGRETEVKSLLALLREHRRIAVTAPGGMGKTALCAEALRRLHDDPQTRHLCAGGIYFHNFYDQPALEQFVAGILIQAGLPERDNPHALAHAALALRAPNTLLYLEGAEKLEDLRPLFAFLDGDSRLVLTTREPIQAGDLPTLPLDPLEENDAARAIHYYANSRPRTKKQGPWPHGPERPGWLLLARDLGGHPLGCRLAGIHCAAGTLDPATFHDQLMAGGLQPLIKGEDSRSNLDILFVQSARVLAPPAREAWQALILGGTGAIPTSLLRAWGIADDTGLHELETHGLARSTQVAAEQPGQTEPAWFLAHALLGEWARTGLEAFGLDHGAFLDRIIEWGDKYGDRTHEASANLGGPARYQVIIPIAAALLREVERTEGIAVERQHWIFFLVARMHSFYPNYLAAEPVSRRCVEAMRTHAGENDPLHAIALNNLAALLQDTNRLAEAEPLMRRALQIDEASLGPMHPRVATHLNNLAQLLKATNRLAEAEPLMRRALQIDEASLGPMHPGVAIDLNNLALLLQDTNRLADAEPLMRRALQIDEASLGPMHPNVAIRLNNLALLLQDTNRLADAEPLMRRALQIDEASLGPMHPTVATYLNNLALVLQATNRLAEAEPLVRRALQIDEASLGPMHPDVAIDLNNLARLLQATNRLAEAEPLMRRGLVIFLRFTALTGHFHPRLRVVVGNCFQLWSKMEAAEDEIASRLAVLCKEAGLSEEQQQAIRDHLTKSG